MPRPEAKSRGGPSHSLRDLRRGEILAAARAIVAKDGLEALTFAALERSLAFTRGVITYHFEDKDELVIAILDSAVAEIDADLRARAAASGGPAQALRAVVHGMVQGFVSHPEAARILLSFWGRLAADPRIRKVNAALYATYRAQARALLAAGRRQRVFRAVDDEAMAALIVGTVLGITTQYYFEPGAFSVEAAVEEAYAVLAARLSK